MRALCAGPDSCSSSTGVRKRRRGATLGEVKRASGRESRERVEAARRQARLALGKDPTSENDYSGQPKAQSAPPQPAAPPATHDAAVLVSTLGEAAARLGVSRAQLERMIDAGAVQALPTGFTRMIPTSEVERLLQAAE